MPGNWGSEHFRITGLNFSGVGDFSLEAAVTMLPARVKQAFYGAAMRQGVLRRSTWNGCAFNAGSMEIQENNNGLLAYSIESSAKMFNISSALVKRFISAWDHSKYPNDREATQALVEMLERIGIFTDPDMPTVKIISTRVYEGNMTDEQLLDSFNVAIRTDALDDELKALVEEAESLLVGV